MKNILFLSNTSLSDPKRGTPLRICNLFRQIQKRHHLWISVSAVAEEFKDSFVPYPSGSIVHRTVVLSRFIRAHKIDWVFTATETGITLPVILKMVTGVKIALDLHGLLHEESYASRRIGRLAYWSMRIKTHLLLSLYDEVFPVAESLIRYYAPFSRGWRVVYGGVAVTSMAHEPPPLQEYIIGYTGNTRPYQGFAFILEAAAALRAERVPVRLNLIVSGDESDVKKSLAKKGLSEVASVHANVTHEEAQRLIAASHVLAIPRPSIPITEYAFPSKLPEYLLTSVPVVVTEVGPIRELKREMQECAVIIPAENIVEHLTDAFMQIYRMSQSERDALGERARTYAIKRFDWEQQGEVVAAAFDH